MLPTMEARRRPSPSVPFRLALIAVCIAALAVASAAMAGPKMQMGAAEDAGKHVDLMVSKAKMDLARLAGFDAVRLTAIWKPGATELDGDHLTALQNAAAAANLVGIRVYLSVYHAGSRTTPLTARNRRNFATFAASIAREVPSIEDYIIGNEPNLNGFWMPQFNKNGTSASPGSYLGLLALTYDSLKEVSPDINVIGGSVSPRGQDDHRSKRHTHSPVRFIGELGKAYQRSGRERPVMDAFAFHPYGDHSSQPPEWRHGPGSKRIGISEYDRLVELLGSAFDGTAQPGSELPIVYDEYGVDTRIPAAKRRIYSGREPFTTKPVSEFTQGNYYRRALEIAYCQPTVEAMLLFHVTDEADLDRWQSGVFYADDTPKMSLAPVRLTIDRLREARSGDDTAESSGGEPERPQIDCAAIEERTVTVGRKAAEAAARRAAASRSRQPRREQLAPWRGKTSLTASRASSPRGGACRSRSGARRRTHSPRSSRTGPGGWRACGPTRLPACDPTATSSSGRSPSDMRTSASSARR